MKFPHKFIIVLFYLGIGLIYNLKAQRVIINQNPGLSSNVVIGQDKFHVSESVYSQWEMGTDNFLLPSASIDKIGFFVQTIGSPATASQFRIWLKEVSDTVLSISSGNYSTDGYINVFDGSITPDSVGLLEIPLSTSFTRTAGKNLQVLIERFDSTNHFGYVFATSNGMHNTSTTLSSRRYNDTTRPDNSTILTATFYRPAIAFIHVFPKDIAVTKIIHPVVSCYDTLQTIGVTIMNQGLNTIDSGEVNVTLQTVGDNVYLNSLRNMTTLTSGAVETIFFKNVSLNNTGFTFDTAKAFLNGDGTSYNDKLNSSIDVANLISVFPVNENMESGLPVFSFFNTLSGNRQLWRVQTGKYSNADMTPDSLNPKAPGLKCLLFDSWTAPVSDGFSSMVYSNCIKMPISGNLGSPTTTMSFFMSHDTLYKNNKDSLYICVSTDKGKTWNIVDGFGRVDLTAITPRWKQHNVDLSSYTDSTIQIALMGVSKYGNAFGVDNINIKFANPVPLHLVSFKAVKQEKSNLLTWTTANEYHMQGFEIERSRDGKTFSNIGSVDATGDGLTKDYSFKDEAPLIDFNYYRLKMIGNDRSFGYSPIRLIQNNPEAIFTVVNPVINQTIDLSISSNEKGIAYIFVYDLTGRLITQQQKAINDSHSHKIEIPFVNHPKSTYLISVLLNDKRYTKKIILK